MTTQAEKAMTLSAMLQRHPDLPALHWSVVDHQPLAGMAGGRADKEQIVQAWAERFKAPLNSRRMVKGGIEITTRFVYGDVQIQVWSHLWEETA